MQRVREVYDVNVFGAMEMTHEFIPLLLASNDACIINVGSVAALTPLPFNAAYNSSKAALLSFGDTLRVELAPFKYVQTFLFNVLIPLSKCQSHYCNLSLSRLLLELIRHADLRRPSSDQYHESLQEANVTR